MIHDPDLHAPPPGVIFDMDGVLILSEEAHFQSWREAGRRRGVEVTRAAFLSCFGRINPDCVRILFGPDIPPDESRAIADEKELAYRAIVADNLPLAPGVVDLARTLTGRGARLAIGSSAPPENIDLILARSGLAPFITVTANGAEVLRGKPAPDVFLLAAQRLAIPPARCTVIEDAPSGIRAAVVAGMRAIAVATTHPAPDLKAAGAHHTFQALADVPPSLLAPGA